MNKNIIIGILVALFVIIGGYLLFKGSGDVATPTPDTSDLTPATSNPTPTNPLVLGSPKVETSASASTSVSTALVTGKVIPNGVSTTYWFEYGETTPMGSKTTSQLIGSGFYAISAPAYISGLKSNTNYYYRLSAHNNFGTTNGAVYVFKTNNDPAPKAAMPTAKTVNATDVSRTTAKINGQINPNGWATNYWFEYGKDVNLNSTTSIKSITDSSVLNNSSSFSEGLSGLEPLTKYYFRLNAQNQFGTVTGTILNFTTSGPMNPGIPTATTSQPSNITNTEAKLNGRVNPNGADTTYWFEYSEDSLLGTIVGSGTPIQTINAGTNTVNVEVSVTGLNKNTKYFYRVIAKNQFGAVNGSIVSFKTRP